MCEWIMKLLGRKPKYWKYTTKEERDTLNKGELDG